MIILNENELNVPIKIFLDWFLNTHIHVCTCAHTQTKSVQKGFLLSYTG